MKRTFVKAQDISHSESEIDESDKTEIFKLTSERTRRNKLYMETLY